MNVVSIPSGNYLSAEDIERMRTPALLDHEPQPEEPPPEEIIPRTQEEALLISELKSLSIEELTERARRVGIDVDLN